VAVSGLESTVAGGCVSVDSKRVCRLCGGGSGGRSGARRRPYLGQVAEWMGRSAVGCRAGRSAQPTERLGLMGRDEILRSADPSGAQKARYAQDDKLDERVRCGQRVFVGPGLTLEMGRRLELEGLELGLASGSGLGLVVWPGRVVEPAPHRSEDRPLHAERIRRPWEAWECAAKGPVVGPGLEVGRAGGFGLVVGRRAEVEAARRGEKPHP
jgi:hypothetical protein